jgi:hypothetical protein
MAMFNAALHDLQLCSQRETSPPNVSDEVMPSPTTQNAKALVLERMSVPSSLLSPDQQPRSLSDHLSLR